jgi:hypothetical protein
MPGIQPMYTVHYNSLNNWNRGRENGWATEQLLVTALKHLFDRESVTLERRSSALKKMVYHIIERKRPISRNVLGNNVDSVCLFVFSTYSCVSSISMCHSVVNPSMIPLCLACLL